MNKYTTVSNIDIETYNLVILYHLIKLNNTCQALFWNNKYSLVNAPTTSESDAANSE